VTGSILGRRRMTVTLLVHGIVFAAFAAYASRNYGMR
jgi:hypothetical protein